MRNNGKYVKREGLGLWECCGELIASGARCPRCGKRKGDADPAGDGVAKPEPVAGNALVSALKVAPKVRAIVGRLRITITRGNGGKPLDYDNLVGGTKPLRDEIARLLGRDDAEHRGIEWKYRQAPGWIRMVEIEKIEEE